MGGLQAISQALILFVHPGRHVQLAQFTECHVAEQRIIGFFWYLLASNSLNIAPRFSVPLADALIVTNSLSSTCSYSPSIQQRWSCP